MIKMHYKGHLVRVFGHPLGWKWSQNHKPVPGGCDGSCSDMEAHIYKCVDQWKSNNPFAGYPANQSLDLHDIHSDSLEELRKLLNDPGDPPTSPMGYNPVREAKRETGVSRPRSGAVCKRCNILNEYAESNQKDGTYVCYCCR